MSHNKLIFFRVWLCLCGYLLASASPVFSQSSADWYMAGANPQRTSWVSDPVDPRTSDTFGIIWYRPIEAYIDQKFQLITVNNVVYVPTAKGLYALDANTGNELWRFDLELPLGQSPTVHENVVYVPGMDKKLYALDAASGALLWNFDQAMAGFSTNPLVVKINGETCIFAGNRDGNMYALVDHGTSWELKWSYNSDSLIAYSAAYTQLPNGTHALYFGNLANKAYGINAQTGAQLWPPLQLPGNGLISFWPVIYRDLVVFTATSALDGVGSNKRPGSFSIDKTRTGEWTIDHPGDYINHDQRDQLFHDRPLNGTSLGPTFTAGSTADTIGINWPWPDGQTVMDATRATEFFEDHNTIDLSIPNHKPWQRTTSAVYQTTGHEYTFDSDGDGFSEYLPFLTIGSDPGAQYPAVAMPDKNGTSNQILYKFNYANYLADWNIPRTRLMGWQYGSQYLNDQGLDFAVDEPLSLSGAGSIVYVNLCCSRNAKWKDLNGNNPHNTEFWNYHRTLRSQQRNTNPLYFQESLAPQFDESWWSGPSGDTYRGGFGDNNATYADHGLQNPFIPHQGKLFIHRENAIIALGPNPPEIDSPSDPTDPLYPTIDDYVNIHEAEVITKKKRPLLTYSRTTSFSSTISSAQLIQELETQLQKFDVDGDGTLDHLRPGYFAGGHDYTAGTSLDWNPQRIPQYFSNPGDTMIILSRAYPLLTDTILKEKLRTYLSKEFDRYFDSELITHIGWNDSVIGSLQSREYSTHPAEILTDMDSADLGPKTWLGVSREYYPQQNIYALYQYAKLVPNDLERAFEIAQSTVNRNIPSTTALAQDSWVLNQYIAGYYGYLGLQSLLSQTPDDQIQNNLQILLDLKVNSFTIENPWSEGNQRRITGISRNYLNLVPELGDYLYDTDLPNQQAAITSYNHVAAYWFATRHDASIGEGNARPLHDQAMFLAKAYILKQPRQELFKYLDAPAYERGDLYYLQNLIATIESPDDPNYYPPPLTQPGDTDSDLDVDYLDFLNFLPFFGSGETTVDWIKDNIIDIFDFNLLIENFGR